MDRSTPFYIEVISISSWTTPSVGFWSTDDVTLDSMEISTDLVTWTTLTPSPDHKYDLINNAVVGDKVYIRAKPTLGTYCTDERFGYSCGYYYGSGCHIKIGGNLLSLFYGSNFTGNETSFIGGTRNCEYLFRSSNVDDASELILTPTTLTRDCYRKMFNFCRSLEKAPAIPQATITLGYPYDYMFQGCSSLETVTLENTNLRVDDYILYDMEPKTIVYKKEGVTTPGNPSNCTVVTLKNTPFNVADAKEWRVDNTRVKRVTDSLGRVIWGYKVWMEPFYVKDVSGEANTVTIYQSDGASPSLDVEYSMDGSTWYNAGNTGNVGGIQVQLPANGKVYLRCLTNSWAKQSGAGNQGYNYINAWEPYEVGGNIMSLLMGSSFDGSTELTSSNASAFRHLFGGYGNNITSANKLILNTTLAEDCYYGMFNGCTSLIAAPSLPATTLANYCYDNMFLGCTSLTIAPVLPATTLYNECYRGMFDGCTNLSYIKCLATDISAYNCITDWVRGVVASGTFYKKAGVTYPSGNSGIPSGWTVVNI